jgi:hypothetical protein
MHAQPEGRRNERDDGRSAFRTGAEQLLEETRVRTALFWFFSMLLPSFLILPPPLGPKFLPLGAK